ncbi:hypothetical protein CDL15_Pgr015558 [Punica granatum]|uniref:Uncharacterized protein n=1 Tax=Punica granatum TaxID=22663 RepID=A0A218W1I1_PUNGR|nr:hypothetical protein CDL15_Pgr015558 [Punica granatum]PKI71103.1 hypothetical protein CRG98_008504 [Punica granatum]
MSPKVDNAKEMAYMPLPPISYHVLEMGTVEEVEEEADDCGMYMMVMVCTAALLLETATLYYKGQLDTVHGQVTLLVSVVFVGLWLATNFVLDRVSTYLRCYQEKGYIWAILLCLTALLVAVPTMIVVLYIACTALD